VVQCTTYKMGYVWTLIQVNNLIQRQCGCCCRHFVDFFYIVVTQVELEKKLDGVAREKEQYRQHLEKALAKIAAVEAREKSAAKAQLVKEKREVEHMRLRYLAAEEKNVITAERRELVELKNELNQ